jgi:anti-sigma factor ChrR (cupin superfamily)
MRHDALTNEQETLAALYVLGSLEPAAAQSFARHLDEDGCEVCRRQVDAMAGVCGDLALAPAPVPPSPAVRARILSEAAGHARGPRRAMPPLAFTFAEDGEWIEIKPGVFMKHLIQPRPDDPSRSYLVRMEPGTVLDRHGHRSFEHCYVVSGSTIVGGRRMGPGDYSYAPRGSVHEAIPSDEGALLFIVETA